MRLLLLGVLMGAVALPAAAQTAPTAFFAVSNGAVGASRAPATAPGGMTTDDVFDGNYQYDDGFPETSVGVTGGGELMWLVAFETQPGFESISSISVVWGDPLANLVEGSPGRVFIYDDPNDDGNPSDAVKLLEAATTIEGANTNTFQIIPVTPTTVSGWFFVGAAYAHGSRQYPGALDMSSTAAGRAWVVGSSTTLNVDNLLDNLIPPGNTVDFSLPGNWLVRAVGGPATNDADGDGVDNDFDLCPGTVIPESVPTVSLEAGRYALVNRNQRFDTMKGGLLSPGPRRFKTTATGGCSCAQIVDRMDAGAKNLKYGCTRTLISDWIATVPTPSTRGGALADLSLGAFEYGTDEFTTSVLPTEFALEGNYPNPFNPVTTIRFDMPEAAPVHLSVFDVMGREVRVLVQGTLEAGRHEASFDGAGLPSGTYLYRLTTPAGVFSKTMVLLK